MKKILIITASLLALLLIAATIAVHLYLTDERIKSLVIPPAEEALGRKVEIGGISVSIFSGIEIRDLSVAEAGEDNVFARIDSFVLKYRLLPLIHKRIEIAEVILKKPMVRISRDEKGRFNFESLALLTESPDKKAKPAARPKAESKSAAMPLAVSIDRIAVEGGRIIVADAKGEIPQSEADFDLGLSLAASGAAPTFKGEGTIRVNSVYGGVKPAIAIKTDFDQSRARAVCDLDIEGEKLTITITAADYLKKPAISLLLSAKRLNIDHLLAVSEKLPKDKPAPAQPAPAAGPDQSKETGPPDLPPVTVKVRVDQVTYQDLQVKTVEADLHSDSDKVFLDRLAAKPAGGEVSGKGLVTLSAPMAYEGQIKVQGISIAEVRKGLRQSGGGIADGSINLSAALTGRGTQWPKLANRLNGDGTYRINQARITRNPYSELLAMALKDPDLAEFTANDLKGTFRIKKGRLILATDLSSSELTLNGKGSIGLASLDLDFPVSATLPPATAARISPEISRALADEQGRVTLGMKLGGTVDSPKLKLDKKALKKAAKKQVKKRAASEAEKLINKELGNRPEADLVRGAAGSLLNGLFGNN